MLGTNQVFEYLYLKAGFFESCALDCLGLERSLYQ